MTIATYQATPTEVILGDTGAVVFTESDEHYRALVGELQSSILSLQDEVARLSFFEQLAHHDELTGIGNRRYFGERLAQEWSRANRYGVALTLVIIDLDDFKSINDTAGHLIGDDVLAFVGRTFAASCREYDVPCRLGGDEFAFILPETDACGAETMMARVEHALTNAVNRPVIPGGLTIRMSYGLAEAHTSASPEVLFERADAAMYLHKRVSKQNRRAAAAAAAVAA